MLVHSLASFVSFYLVLGKLFSVRLSDHGGSGLVFTDNSTCSHLLCVARNPTFVGPLASPEMVSLCPDLDVLSQLRFHDPDHFGAGMIYHSLPVWESLLADFNCSSVDLLEIVQDGVQVERFFTPFKGDFKGQFYHAQTPPAIRINNSAICTQFTDFITDTFVHCVASGVLAVWGKVGVVSPSYLVLPITVEPSKPHLCHAKDF